MSLEVFVISPTIHPRHCMDWVYHIVYVSFQGALKNLSDEYWSYFQIAAWQAARRL